MLSLLIPSSVFAANVQPGRTACTDQVTQSLEKAQTQYRAAVFGTAKNDDGTFAARTGGTVPKKMKGVFESKKRLTSELVEPLVEDYRSLRCHALSVCLALNQSFTPGSLATVTVRALGCDSEQLPTFDACRFSADGLMEERNNAQTFCSQAVDSMLAMEKADLKAAVAYDSEYRSALQQAGIVDATLGQFRRYAIRPILSLIQLLGRLHQIPCFLSQCDMPNASASSASSSPALSTPAQ